MPKKSFGRAAYLTHRQEASELPCIMALAFQPCHLIHLNDLPRYAQNLQRARPCLPESP